MNIKDLTVAPNCSTDGGDSTALTLISGNPSINSFKPIFGTDPDQFVYELKTNTNK